jgi:hypothetical protein
VLSLRGEERLGYRAYGAPFLTPLERDALERFASLGSRRVDAQARERLLAGTPAALLRRLVLRGLLSEEDGRPRITFHGRTVLESADRRPLLCVDLDGVLSVDEPSRVTIDDEVVVDGARLLIPRGMRSRIERLQEQFACVWASSWEHDAGSAVGRPLGVAGWPVISLTGARYSEPTWKLHPVSRWAADRPLAWIDDELGGDAREWAAEREAAGVPTMLVRCDPHVGLREVDTKALLRFAQSVRRGRQHFATRERTMKP